METVLHLFRHGEEDPVHRKVAAERPGGRLTRKGVDEVINSAFLLRERIPDEKGVEVQFIHSPKVRAMGVNLGAYHTMRAKYKNAKLRSPEIVEELDLPGGNRKLAAELFERMGRADYIKAWAAGELPNSIEGIESFDKRIIENTLGKAVKMSKAKGKGTKHLVAVTHDGGTSVSSGFGKVLEHLIHFNPQQITDKVNRDQKTGQPYSGPMRTGEYIGVHLQNGVAHLVEFRGKWFAPGKKGEAWKEMRSE